MYLVGAPIFSMMLIGRWSSLTFLKYIQKQVQEFSFGISSNKIEVQTFKHINDPHTTNTMDSIVGIKIPKPTLKHHHRRTGAGVVPNKIWSKPNLVIYDHQTTSAGDELSCTSRAPPYHIFPYSSGVVSTSVEAAVHILCTFFFVTGRDSLFGTLLAEVHSAKKSKTK
jgi:hypothetical protein